MTSPPRTLDGYLSSGDRRTDGEPAVYDELLAPDGSVRAAWQELVTGLGALSPLDLQALGPQVDRLLDNDGVSYHPVSASPTPGVVGPDRSGSRWRLDPVPLVVDADTWTDLESGHLQRSRVLDALLGDVYGTQSVLHRGLLPPQLVLGHPGYLRRAHGITIPGVHQLFLHAVDVVRTADGGGFQALGDRTQAPSGAGYAMADRRAVSRVLPAAFAHTAPHGLGGFFRTLRRALEAVAPAGVDDPRIVLLSPGTLSETAFDQAFLASLLGLPLVNGADLTVRRGRLRMRALGRLERVDVVLRRVDADFSDPLDLRPDSRLGVVGLLEMSRRGRVTVVNSFGSGVLESPALAAFLPRLCRALLGEELRLPPVPTFWCGQAAQRSHVLANLDSMLLRPTSPGPEVDGALLSGSERETWRRRVAAEPDSWVGQQLPETSRAPVAAGGALRPGRVGMRLFSVAQQSGYVSMPGALGRVFAPGVGPAAGMVAAAKDVWVRSGRPETVSPPTGPLPAARGLDVRHEPKQPMAVTPVTSPRALGELFWLGRYAERAEDLTRLLMAARDRATDFRFRPEAEGAGCVPVLLAAVSAVSASGVSFGDGVDVLAAMRALVLDERRPGTVAQSLAGMHQAASAVRDQLSVDTWTVLAGIDRAMSALADSPRDEGMVLQETHTAVLLGMLALSGLAKENMIRDAGWHLMDAGRRIERGQQLTALLRATLTRQYPRGVQTLVVESVLAVTESIMTHRRRYRGRSSIDTVCELLLLETDNPRSLAYQLDALSDDLRALPDSSGASRPERRLAQLAATVRRCSPADLAVAVDGRRPELDSFLRGVHASLRELADLVAARHFWHQVEMQPLGGPTPGSVGAAMRTYRR